MIYPQVVATTNCSRNELRTIRNKDECERKATLLGLADTSASVVHAEQRPYGCIYATNDWLGMNTALPGSELCGSTDSGFYYSCMCEKECKAIGSKCYHSDDCCIRHCSQGICNYSNYICRESDRGCKSDLDCCTRHCINNVCRDRPGLFTVICQFSIRFI